MLFLVSAGAAIAVEAHNGLSGMIVESCSREEAGMRREFDAIWISSCMPIHQIINLIP